MITVKHYLGYFVKSCFFRLSSDNSFQENFKTQQEQMFNEILVSTLRLLRVIFHEFLNALNEDKNHG